MLTTLNGAGHVDGFCKSYDRSYGRSMNEMTYQDFVTRGIAPAGAYVFGDRWRMNSTQARVAGLLWDQLAEASPQIRLLNNPNKQLDRFAFLRNLHEGGINDFNAYREDELSNSIRYPVFVRRDDDHFGPLTELIPTREDLDRELSTLMLSGHDRRRLIVIEYIDTVSKDGIYRKYGAMRIGDVIFPHHIMQAREWHTKAAVRIRTDEAIDESDAYTLANPHADLVMPIFERAGIEYGRMDYGMAGDRIQAWEINDNPVFMHMGAKPQSRLQRHIDIKAAFDNLGDGLNGEPVRFELNPKKLWRALG